MLLQRVRSRKSRAELRTKASSEITWIYVVLPFDVIPDFIPVLGEMDDVAAVLSGLWLFGRLCPPDVVREKVSEALTYSQF
jgi:uncharacterized membrane protein YkvA (DUF1232 family)